MVFKWLGPFEIGLSKSPNFKYFCPDLNDWVSDPHFNHFYKIDPGKISAVPGLASLAAEATSEARLSCIKRLA